MYWSQKSIRKSSISHMQTRSQTHTQTNKYARTHAGTNKCAVMIHFWHLRWTVIKHHNYENKQVCLSICPVYGQILWHRVLFLNSFRYHCCWLHSYFSHLYYQEASLCLLGSHQGSDGSNHTSVSHNNKAIVPDFVWT